MCFLFQATAFTAGIWLLICTGIEYLTELFRDGVLTENDLVVDTNTEKSSDMILTEKCIIQPSISLISL